MPAPLTAGEAISPRRVRPREQTAAHGQETDARIKGHAEEGPAPPKLHRDNMETTTNAAPTLPAIAPRRPIAEILADLSKPIPPRHLSTKRKGGAELTFCPWYRVNKILTYYTAGAWHYEIRERTVTENRLMITVRVTIEAAEGCFWKDGTGIEDLAVKGYGDEQSNAESMAFRRACARFGLGLDLYEKED